MVVKIGSSTVVGADGKVNRAFIGGLADQAAALRKLGWRLVVVSSGAIACGYPVLGFDRKPVGDLPSLQACASAGQCIISSAYDEEFHARDLLTSLVLLTRHDTARRTSYLHARDALLRLVELGVVPGRQRERYRHRRRDQVWRQRHTGGACELPGFCRSVRDALGHRWSLYCQSA